MSVSFMGFQAGNLAILKLVSFNPIIFIVSSDGEPNKLNTLNSYSISDSPSNSTLQVASSANTQPIDQISIS